MQVSYFTPSRVRQAFLDGWRLYARHEYTPHDYAVLLCLPGDVDPASPEEIARWLEYLMPTPEVYEIKEIRRTTDADRAGQPFVKFSKNGKRRYTAKGYENLIQGARNLHLRGLDKRRRGMTQADHDFIDKKLAQMVAAE